MAKRSAADAIESFVCRAAFNLHRKGFGSSELAVREFDQVVVPAIAEAMAGVDLGERPRCLRLRDELRDLVARVTGQKWDLRRLCAKAMKWDRFDLRKQLPAMGRQRRKLTPIDEYRYPDFERYEDKLLSIDHALELASQTLAVCDQLAKLLSPDGSGDWQERFDNLTDTQRAVLNAVVQLNNEGNDWPVGLEIEPKSGYQERATKDALALLVRLEFLEKGPSGRGYRVPRPLRALCAH